MYDDDDRCKVMTAAHMVCDQNKTMAKYEQNKKSLNWIKKKIMIIPIDVSSLVFFEVTL